MRPDKRGEVSPFVLRGHPFHSTDREQLKSTKGAKGNEIITRDECCSYELDEGREARTPINVNVIPGNFDRSPRRGGRERGERIINRSVKNGGDETIRRSSLRLKIARNADRYSPWWKIRWLILGRGSSSTPRGKGEISCTEFRRRDIYIYLVLILLMGGCLILKRGEISREGVKN